MDVQKMLGGGLLSAYFVPFTTSIVPYGAIDVVPFYTKTTQS